MFNAVQDCLFWVYPWVPRALALGALELPTGARYEPARGAGICEEMVLLNFLTSKHVRGPGRALGLLSACSFSAVLWVAACGSETEDASAETSAMNTDSHSGASGHSGHTGDDPSESSADTAQSSSAEGKDNSPDGESGVAPTTPGDETSEPIERATVFDAGSDPDRNKVSAADLCTRIAEINCAGEAYCCDSPGRTVEACKQDLLNTCASELMLDRVAMQERTRFDAEAAARAYEELERRASMCDPTVAQWGGAPEGLRGLLKGSIAAGESCKPTETIPDPVTLAAALLSCANPETHACVYASPLDAWTCEPRSSAGGGCITDNNCEDGLYCVITTPGLPGTCTARKAVGDACDAPTQCASLFCKRAKCVEADQQAAYCLVN